MQAELASLLGALAALYVPLEMREGVKEKATKVDCLGWAGTKVSMYVSPMVDLTALYVPVA
jgi:hypothetical protein